MPYRYAILDVFTDKPLAGNPLAVLPDATGLDDRAMQAIAREFNLSETVFVFPATRPAHTASIRIFTPGRELPFAGHPTVGTALFLARERSKGNAMEMVLMLEEKVGPVRCGVHVTSSRTGHAIFDIPKNPEAVEGAFDREAVAMALGLVPAEIGFENHKISGFTAGVPYIFVPVRDAEAVARSQINRMGWKRAFADDGAAAYVYTRVPGERRFRARMYAPGFGIGEDPATGSAAAAFAGVIARFDEPPGGSHRYVIEQGFEMGRPSIIVLEIDMDGGAVAAARIGGDAVIIAEGTLDV